MISEVIQKYKAALQRLINNQPDSSGVKISCDGVANAAWHRNSSSKDNDNSPKVYAPKNNVQRAQPLRMT